MDFDDLLVNAVRLFQTAPDVLAEYQQRFQHVLVDEYQDTNRAQNELIVLLGKEHRNVCVVGDSDQSIYKFRGADIRNILEFEEAFPDATVVVLDQNYRSTQRILDAANAVIANNFGRKPKDLWSEQGAGEKILRYHADDETDEAQWVANRLHDLHDQENYRWGDLAIFYRANAQSRVIEEHLMRVGIPYQVIGGTRFYDRREVKDAMAYVKAVVNPIDEVSVKRILNVPRRGIGDATIGRLDSWANSQGLAFVDALRRQDEAGVTGKAVRGIASFVELLDELADVVPNGPGALLEAVLERSGYVAELEAERSIESEGRLENLSELVGVARDFESVDEFLEQVGLVSDTDQLDDEDSAVVLMTLALGQGPRVPRGVRGGHGGRGLPPHAVDGRARRAGGGAAAGLRRPHPGPAAPAPDPRVEPDALRDHAVQPAQPLPGRDPGRAGRVHRGQPAGEPTGRRGLPVGGLPPRSGGGPGPHRRAGHGPPRTRAVRGRQPRPAHR